MNSKEFDENFHIVPGNLPNSGRLFVDHQKEGRSGHGGNCLVQCENGDIISFYSNVSSEAWNLNGHGVGGWSEYKRSKDGGETWSEPVVLDYSREVWEGNEFFAALVFSVIKAPNGTIIAVVARFENEKWVKKAPPVCLLSQDHGKTWSLPREIDASASVEDLSLTFDAAFVYKESVFIVFMGGAADYCPGQYSLYVSADNGLSFSRRSIIPFEKGSYYSTAGVLDDGRIIVYSYLYRGSESDESNLRYVVSDDGGCTWSEVKMAFFARKIRNPQMSRKLGGYYFMHGRSGSYGAEAGHLVLYRSKDGLNWDEGIYLHKATGVKCGDAYSANTVVAHQCNGEVVEKLMIQSSISYDEYKVNECQWFVWPKPLGNR